MLLREGVNFAYYVKKIYKQVEIVQKLWISGKNIRHTRILQSLLKIVRRTQYFSLIAVKIYVNLNNKTFFKQ